MWASLSSSHVMGVPSVYTGMSLSVCWDSARSPRSFDMVELGEEDTLGERDVHRYHVDKRVVGVHAAESQTGPTKSQEALLKY